MSRSPRPRRRSARSTGRGPTWRCWSRSSANSPFWHGEDTGYASYRTQIWQRWPTAGATGAFGTPECYDQVVADLIASGAALDEGMIYFDARPSRHYPTLELRVADVCLSVDEAVLVAALGRALVTTAAERWAAGEAVPDVRPEQLRAASWRAARVTACPARCSTSSGVSWSRPGCWWTDWWNGSARRS